MGTNYYLQTTLSCPHCGRNDVSRLHIGKSSAGWYFGLRIYPDDPNQLAPFGITCIVELDDWRPLFERFRIVDEYDRPVASEDMLKEITKRSHPNGLLSRLTAGSEHIGPYRHSPNELFAGAGTYDLCAYEFS